MLLPHLFVQNIQNNNLQHSPPVLDQLPAQISKQYHSDFFKNDIEILKAVCTYTAQLLSA